MVTLLSLLKHHKILIEHLLLGERDAIETLHLLTCSITAPEGTSHTRELDGLDLTCIDKVRTTTKVREVTLCISRDRTILEVLLNMLALIGLSVGSKLLQSLSLRHFATHNRLFFRSQFLHLLFNLWEIALLDALTVLQQHIIEEAILDSGSKTELDTWIQLL